MKLLKCSFAVILVLLIATLTGCADKSADDSPQAEQSLSDKVAAASGTKETDPTQLPVRFKTPGYLAATSLADEEVTLEEDEYRLKVGATIRSTSGAQPLWDILNRLAALKSMSVSWAGDVDQNVLVDVNIAADDDFFTAIDNLLRQVDYFEEVEGNTIVVKYRATKKFFVGVPNMKGNYTSTIGGNYLTDRDAATGTEGTVKITSDDNSFDVWSNIETNLDKIMQQWTTVATTPVDDTSGDAENKESSDQNTQHATRRIANSGSYYTLDKSVGLITVTAPKPLLNKVELYITTLKKELYKQVVIEAKIIEVYLQDNSKIGLDWSNVLKDFSITGTTYFGTAGSDGDGQVYPWIPSDGDSDSTTSFVSKITMDNLDFNVMLNALNEQGDATVLSNPKITVLNGQPAVISVGSDITYIESVEADVDDDGDVTYTVETDSVVEGVALGVLATIVDDDAVILHLTPITTDLEEDPIEYKEIGSSSGTVAAEIGLPRVKVRNMSTMVEVKNGEMLVIGGLIDSTESTDSAFAPIVGDIPVIKYLFGYEEKKKIKREMVILLTPRIIN